ncbi:MAG: ComEC/Rec2 family competence protein [Pseudomonadota bacterium]
METSALRNSVGQKSFGVSVVTHLIDQQRGHLFPWISVFFGGGAALYFGLPFEPPLLFYASLGSVLGLLALIWGRMGRAVSPLVIALACSAAGVLWTGYHAHRVALPVLEFRYYGPIEGRIVKIDKSNSNKPRLTLDQVVLYRVSPERTPRYVRVSLHGDQPFIRPEPGLRVMTTGHLSPPSGPIEPGGYDFQRKAWFDQLGGLGYTRVPMLVLEPAKRDSFSLWLYNVRRAISGYLKDQIGGREGPFAAAILTGDRADLDPEALVALRASNLAHLLAISGLHMGLLTGVVFTLVRFGMALFPSFAMRRDAKKMAALAALIVGLGYLGLSGASVATQRAFVMVCVMLCAVLLDRRAITLRSVAIAALIVLLLSPDSITGPGFQMSFAATTALVAVFAYLRDTSTARLQARWVQPVFALVVSSGIAGLATAPFGAAHFNQIAQYGLLANLLSVPIMGTVVMPGAVAALVLFPFGLDWIGLEVTRLGLAWIIGVAEFVSGLGGSVSLVKAPPMGVLPILGVGGLILCLWQGRGRLAGLGVLAVAFGLWMMHPRPMMLISDTGRLVGVLADQGRALNKPRGDGFAARGWLENDGDPVDQDRASQREGHEANYLSVRLAGDEILFLAEKDLSSDDIARLCADHTFLILPLHREPLPCRGLTARSFWQGGAHSLHPGPDGLDVKNSNAVRGPRLWVR